MTITEWILFLTAAAFLLAPVAALSLRPIEDREALLRDVIGTIPSGKKKLGSFNAQPDRRFVAFIANPAAN